MCDVLASVAPSDSTLIVVPDLTHWYAAQWLDTVTRRRAVRPERAIVPTVVESNAVGSCVRALNPAVATARAAYPALRCGVESGLPALRQQYVVGPSGALPSRIGRREIRAALRFVAQG